MGLSIVTTTTLATPKVRFSAPLRPGLQVKTEVVSQILQALGYQTGMVSITPILAKLGTTPSLIAVSTGDVDVLLGVWLPTNKTTLDAVLKKGRIVIAGVNLRDTTYGIVVPDYVWKSGVHSIADLHKHPDKFGKRIYGLEAGSYSNLVIEKAIRSGLYDLQGWHVVSSSKAAMLAQAKHSINRQQWVAFLGWQPHWMNTEFNLKYLKDPKNMWAHGSRVVTIANKQFLEENSPIARFLKQFVVKSKTQEGWVRQYRGRKIDKTAVAGDWIMQHENVVGQWLRGVKALNGKPASEMVHRAFSGQ